MGYIVKLSDLPPKLDSLDLILDKIVEGDCLDLMRRMPDGCVDAVITDPPYGIGFKYDNYDDSPNLWFLLMISVVPQIRRIAPFVVMPCCAIARMDWWYVTHRPDWLIAWYKGSPGHRSYIGFNDWEPLIVWGKPYQQMHDYFQTRCGFELDGHPCPKPIDWALWLCKRAAPSKGIIFDPFLGSGTTAVAAKKLGRHFIGCEINPDYCKIAERRLLELDAQPGLFGKAMASTPYQASESRPGRACGPDSGDCGPSKGRELAAQAQMFRNPK